MSQLRTGVTAVASAVCSFLLVQAASCGTDAVGVDDCREIETARCEAAANCRGDLQVDDVDACKRYYRDHCLHGLGVSEAPGEPILNSCIQAIQTAGECAAEDPEMTIADCRAFTEPHRDQYQLRRENEHADLATVCEIVQYPERSYECGHFLNEVELPPEETGGAGGAEPGAAGTSNGGAAG